MDAYALAAQEQFWTVRWGYPAGYWFLWQDRYGRGLDVSAYDHALIIKAAPGVSDAQALFVADQNLADPHEGQVYLSLPLEFYQAVGLGDYWFKYALTPLPGGAGAPGLPVLGALGRLLVLPA